MKERDEQFYEEDRIDRDAAEWVVKQDRGFSASEQDAFFEWLADDPRHGERYARHGQSLREANLLAEWRPEHSAAPNPDLLASREGKRRWFKWGGGAMALAASIVIVLSVVSRFEEPGPGDKELQQAHFLSEDYQYQVLVDGSELDLNAGSEVLVSYTGEVRRVKLLAGEAYFKVAKNPDRPFVVEVNGTEVSALGTAFNIRYQDEAVEVVVTEGRIRWERPVDEEERATGGVVPLPYREMVSGQKSFITSEDEISDHLVIEEIEVEEIEAVLGWRHSLLEFESTPLEKAVFEFNRRNSIQLVIDDPVLLDEPIVGSVRSDNIDRFVLLLEAAIGIDADKSEPGRIVLRKGREI